MEQLRDALEFGVVCISTPVWMVMCNEPLTPRLCESARSRRRHRRPTGRSYLRRAPSSSALIVEKVDAEVGFLVAVEGVDDQAQRGQAARGRPRSQADCGGRRGVAAVHKPWNRPSPRRPAPQDTEDRRPRHRASAHTHRARTARTHMPAPRHLTPREAKRGRQHEQHECDDTRGNTN